MVSFLTFNCNFETGIKSSSENKQNDAWRWWFLGDFLEPINLKHKLQRAYGRVITGSASALL